MCCFFIYSFETIYAGAFSCIKKKEPDKNFCFDIMNDNIDRTHICVYHFVVLEKKKIRPSIQESWD